MRSAKEYQPIPRFAPEHRQIQLLGFEALQKTQTHTGNPELFESFSPNTAYRDYMEMPKLFANHDSGRTLIEIGEKLSEEWLPDYLDAAGWAAAEAALACDDLPAKYRMQLLNGAEDSWQRAITNQGALTESREKRWLMEHVKEYRLALNLAFVPLMKSLVAGDVTEGVREKTFADTLAITESAAERAVHYRELGKYGTAGSYIGFGHEGNALLSFLYANDPKNLAIPSTYRAGTGYEHRAQTHDITVIGQKWGKINRIFPVEVKAKPKGKDKRRYKALIIKGRSHLTLPGDRLPFEATAAFAACYKGVPTERQMELVRHSSTTVRDLLELYRKGDVPEEFIGLKSHTSFHKNDHVVRKYRELALGDHVA